MGHIGKFDPAAADENWAILKCSPTSEGLTCNIVFVVCITIYIANVDHWLPK